jgi:hypothetical protein
MFNKQYRIVEDAFAGYECQCKRWWFPFWIQMHDRGRFTNTFHSLDKAKAFIEKGGSPAVVVYNPKQEKMNERRRQ